MFKKIEYLFPDSFFVKCRYEMFNKMFNFVGLFMCILLLCNVFSIFLPIPYETILLPGKSIRIQPGDYYQLDAESTVDESILKYESKNEEIVTILGDDMIYVPADVMAEVQKVSIFVMDDAGNIGKINVCVVSSTS